MIVKQPETLENHTSENIIMWEKQKTALEHISEEEGVGNVNLSGIMFLPRNCLLISESAFDLTNGTLPWLRAAAVWSKENQWSFQWLFWVK